MVMRNLIMAEAHSHRSALLGHASGSYWVAIRKNIPVYKKIGKQVQGYCKVHHQRYQGLVSSQPPHPRPQAHPTSPALKYLQASPEITSPFFSDQRDLSDHLLRVHSDEPDLHPLLKMAQASSESRSEGMQIANAFFAVRQGGELELWVQCGKADFRHERYPRRKFFFFANCCTNHRTEKAFGHEILVRKRALYGRFP